MKNVISAILRTKKLTQVVVADRICITPQYFNRIVKGKTIPSIILGIKIAKAIGVDVEDLWNLE